MSKIPEETPKKGGIKAGGILLAVILGIVGTCVVLWLGTVVLSGASAGQIMSAGKCFGQALFIGALVLIAVAILRRRRDR